MNPNELEQAEMQIREAQLKADRNQLNSSQQDIMLQEREKGMVSEQLDVTEILENIHNLLQGNVLQKDERTGELTWFSPEDEDMIILSEHGINYIMGAVQWYLNKNTLLSNYDDEQINAKMEDLGNTINDDIFMEYDKMFLYPSLNSCKTELRKRIKAKVDVRKFALELMGKEANEKEIEDVILKEMEERIIKEMEVIKEQKMKNKLKRFESLIRFIQDTIHSAYQRAWKGQERTTLRQHIHISENKGGGFMPSPQASYNPFNMFKR